MLIGLLLAVLVGTVAYGFLAAIAELRRERADATVRAMLALFAPAMGSAAERPSQLLIWHPVAQTARRVFPDAFRRLDEAAGGSFPFTRDTLQQAHDRCTAEWLAWERTHDQDYKIKAADLERQLDHQQGSDRTVTRARLDAIERENLETYQHRYEEYIRTAKALALLTEDPRGQPDGWHHEGHKPA